MPSKDKQDESIILNVIAFFLTILFIIWLLFGITPINIYNHLNANVFNKELNNNATLAIESLHSYSKGGVEAQQSGSVTFKNCKSETEIEDLFNRGKNVRYSIDWNKVDWDSLAFFKDKFGRKKWRMYCVEDCEFVGRQTLRKLVMTYSIGSFDERANTSMIKNHIQKIKLACSSN
ncbi:MAG: hypothetical protein HOM88_07260 [Hellea sp.]|jgi:hypothetical protein|nr:hypothetical protein [Hellea sp.]